ncbi:MAG: hypothetical protein COX57_10390 [Alphaproteobacteria bacterium CG_4_10_14_0_2_um_filter_63_37]|nr:MAG: hypothetical protein AUJ55_00555 [Proteobacteria bacterium CG1_02_64_396]PJA23989.1 MAG: hypothetical protein COX57_10390 [Alphaproteobacteria bacterium CG_4_10_14_0_2_um_filter_63_37]
MKRIATTAAVLLALAAPLSAQAEDGPRASIGIGSYAVAIVNTDIISTTDTFSGGALVGTLPFDETIALRAHFYSLKGVQDGKGTILSSNNITLTGADFAILFGTNWAQGGNLYVGAGGFSEKFGNSTSGASSNSFSGGMGVLGLGYNGGFLAIDFSVAIRSASKYDTDIFFGTGNTAASSASLDLSFFF